MATRLVATTPQSVLMVAMRFARFRTTCRDADGREKHGNDAVQHTREEAGNEKLQARTVATLAAASGCLLGLGAHPENI